MTPRQLVSIFVPFAILGGAAVLWQQSRSSGTESDPPAGSSPLDENFDYFITGMRRTNFTGEGRLAHTLDASEVVHYPADDRADLTQPRLVWYAEDGTSSELVAREGALFGTSTPDEELLRLRDEVTLTRPTEDGSPMVVRTSLLDAAIEAREFATDSPVTLDSGGMRMESMGMRGNLLDDRLELLHDVRGRHDPISITR